MQEEEEHLTDLTSLKLLVFTLLRSFKWNISDIYYHFIVKLICRLPKKSKEICPLGCWNLLTPSFKYDKLLLKVFIWKLRKKNWFQTYHAHFAKASLSGKKSETESIFADQFEHFCSLSNYKYLVFSCSRTMLKAERPTVIRIMCMCRNLLLEIHVLKYKINM